MNSHFKVRRIADDDVTPYDYLKTVADLNFQVPEKKDKHKEFRPLFKVKVQVTEKLKEDGAGSKDLIS